MQEEAMDSLFFPDGAIALETIDPGKVTRKVKAHGDRTMIVEVFFETGAIGSEHAHPHEQLSYCLGGEFDFFIEGKVRSMRAGDSVLIPGGARHGVKCLAKGRLLDVFSPPREDFLSR